MKGLKKCEIFRQGKKNISKIKGYSFNLNGVDFGIYKSDDKEIKSYCIVELTTGVACNKWISEPEKNKTINVAINNLPNYIKEIEFFREKQFSEIVKDFMTIEEAVKVKFEEVK